MQDKVNEILEYRQQVAALIRAVTRVNYRSDGSAIPGFKLKDLAHELGVTSPTLSKCKTGVASMNPIAFAKLQKLVQSLDILPF